MKLYPCCLEETWALEEKFPILKYSNESCLAYTEVTELRITPKIHFVYYQSYCH